MSDTAINLLLQIPLAGVVVFVVVLFLRHLKDYNTEIIKFLNSQDISTRDFLREQRQQGNEAVARLAEEIKEIGKEVARMNGVLSAHDARAQERQQK